MLRLILSSTLIVCFAGLSGCGEGKSSSQTGMELGSPTTQSTGSTSARATTGPSTRSSADSADPGYGHDTGTSGPSDVLTGTWLAENVSAPVGDVKVRLRFREDGPVKLIAISELPFVGEVKNTESPYSVEGGKIVAPEIRGGVSMPYHFEGDELVLEYKPGQTVRFRKIKEEDPAGE